MNKWIVGDERTERIGDRLGFIFLGLTQLGLYLVLVYQRYVQDLPAAYYNDVALILILSVLGYWGARFFFGGCCRCLHSGRCWRFTWLWWW